MRRGRAAALLALVASMALLPAQAQLPTLGDGNEMSLAAERKIGDQIAREIYRDPDYVDDPVLQEYTQDIWQSLLAAARQRGELPPELDERFAWDVLLIRDRTVNAFALPGGYMGVHLGLIGIVTSRDELASVLAHELSHITQRHIARMQTRQSRQTPWMLGAMILGALAASRNPNAANAVIMGGQAAIVQNQLNFSRDMEREADRIGFGVMTQAGFAPQGFVSMFDKLHQANRLNDNGAFPYLRSHPLTTERIADMQARQPLGAKAEPLVTTLAHAMLAARARVLANPAADALRSWVSEPDSASFASLDEPRQAAALYAGVLASVRQREFAQARRFLGRLATLVETDAGGARQVRLLVSEVAWAAGDAAHSLAVLGADTSSRRPEMLLAAQARIRLGGAAEVAQQLQGWLATHARDASAWQWLAAAHTAQGQTLRAIRDEAEVRVTQLDYSAAVDRLKAAQNLVRRGETGRQPADHIDASIIDTRLRELESRVREQALER